MCYAYSVSASACWWWVWSWNHTWVKMAVGWAGVSVASGASSEIVCMHTYTYIDDKKHRHTLIYVHAHTLGR